MYSSGQKHSPYNIFYITLHYITVHYITVQYITLQYSTLHYSTVQHSGYSIAHLIAKSFSHARDHPRNSIHVQYCRHLSQVLLTFFCACKDRWNTVWIIPWVMWNNLWIEFHMVEYYPEDPISYFTEHDRILSGGSHDLCYRTWWNTVWKIPWVMLPRIISGQSSTWLKPG